MTKMEIFTGYDEGILCKRVETFLQNKVPMHVTNSMTMRNEYPFYAVTILYRELRSDETPQEISITLNKCGGIEHE